MKPQTSENPVEPASSPASLVRWTAPESEAQGMIARAIHRIYALSLAEVSNRAGDVAGPCTL